ncbi:hypothetical protein [Streptomyces asoensis]|uniref:hypothetical protein n=1 Tax=Streptomyces asoensis TaxID=249586 RepID=UPI003409E8FB
MRPWTARSASTRGLVDVDPGVRTCVVGPGLYASLDRIVAEYLADIRRGYPRPPAGSSTW